jgi:hypothetical protein
LAFRVVEKLSDRFWMRLQTPFWKRASDRAIFTKYRCTGSDERLSDVWSDGGTAAEAISLRLHRKASSNDESAN